MFDHNTKICKIDIPEKVPLLWEFVDVIGVAEVIRDDKGLIVKGETFSDNVVNSILLENKKFGARGFYNKVKMHMGNYSKIMDECSLRGVSITLAPVCEEYYVEVVKG